MSKTITLEEAEHRTGAISSLFEVILEKASGECSQQLLDLLYIACDANQDVNKALREEMKARGHAAAEVDHA